MDAQEIKMLNKYAETNDELKSLWNEHQLYEKQLEKLESKSFHTPAEDTKMKELKKQKLDGKTRLVALLDKCKKA